MSHERHPEQFTNPIEGLSQDREPILYDGCADCESRARMALYSLDRQFTEAVWRKMVLVEHEHEGRYRSDAEARACKQMYEVAVFLERFTAISPWTLEVGVPSII